MSYVYVNKNEYVYNSLTDHQLLKGKYFTSEADRIP